MKKFLFFLLKWFLLIAYLVLVLGFVKHQRLKAPYSKLNIIIQGDHCFLDTTIVNKMLTTNGIYVDSISLYSINFDSVEELFLAHPSVQNVEVFADNYGELNIVIEQRSPVLRVMPPKEEGFYIDIEGLRMPLSDTYTARVPVLSGYISPEFIESLGQDSVSNKLLSQYYSYTLQDVYHMALYIYYDDLWASQVQQMYINVIKDMEIVPVVGNHIICLGGVSDYRKKLWKMEAMYREGFKLTDWNAYKEINLKYSNQVICSK